MADKAPRSSQRARMKLLRAIPIHHEDLVMAMTVTTVVREMADGNHRAVTTMSRPCAGWPDRSRNEFDQAVIRALSDLPGSTRSVTITMGRTYEIEWDGVRAPV